MPVVASVHNTKPERWEKVELFALRHGVRRLIAVGSTIAEFYGPMLKGRSLIVVPNPVSISPPDAQKAAQAARSELAEDPSRPLLVSVGRLEPQKGYPDLLTAMDILKRTHPEAFLVVAGTGRMQDELTERIRECGLQEQVRLLGLREDIPQILAAADMYVSVSLWEGLPIAVLEAMASGLPIVATAVGDVAEILSHDRGILVPAAQPDQLAKAVAILLENRELAHRLGVAACDYVLAHHRATRGLTSCSRSMPKLSGDRGGGLDPMSQGLRPIRVAMLIQEYPPIIGGAEQELAAQAGVLARLGVDVQVLTRRWWPELAPFERTGAATVYRLPATGPKAIGAVRYILASASRLGRLHPDILHAHELLSPTSAAIVAKWLLRTPIIATVLRGGLLGDLARFSVGGWGRFARGWCSAPSTPSS